MFASKDIFLKSSGNYQISRSVRFRQSASAYFNRTLTTPTNNKIWTWSGWVKRGTLIDGSTQRLFTANGLDSIFFGSYDATEGYLAIYLNGAASGQLITTARYRDPSAWYHFVIAFDTTQATAANRVKIYVNGVQVTAFSTATYPSQNYNTAINSAVSHTIGNFVSANYFDGYMTEVNFVDGQALTPSSFGETNAVTGVWQPKKYAGTYGNNGFYLNFSDNSAATATTIGKDYSGNGNNWTPNNISVTAGVTYDSMIDVPTLYADGGNGRGNYPVFNPIRPGSTLSDGNLKAASLSFNATATQQVNSGKWYCEFTLDGGTNYNYFFGVYTPDLSSSYAAMGMCNGGNSPNIFSCNTNTNGTVTQPTGSRPTQPAVIGLKLDIGAGSIEFLVNGTVNGSITGITNWSSGQDWLFFASSYTGTFGYQPLIANFGQRPFTNTVPTGYVALNTQNLPTPTISNGAQYMAATLYSGNSGTQSITNTVNGVAMEPGLVWGKSRNIAENHALFDIVRGVNKTLYANLTNAEATDPGVSAFNSNGFTLNGATMNATGYTYVAWQWKAGGTAVSNTAGSITSSVSANTTAGFSVVTYTGTGANATVGHGLGVAPSMIITKPRNSVDNWISWHTALGATGYIYLNLTNASATGATVWNSTLPSSTVFSIGTSSNINSSGQTQVAYCFAEVAGYSKFGSYTGNGSADGPFVYCGFRPRFVMYKRTDTSTNWVIWDTSRNTYNVVNNYLLPNSSGAEGALDSLDILSNGFKLRTSNSDNNGSGGTFIYAAFAENPFKNSLAR